MNSFFSSIIEWFQKVFGKNVEDKGEVFASDFKDVSEISITSIVSESLSSLTLSDSSISIVGDNQRAKYIGKIASNMWFRLLMKIANVCLGTGDCMVKCNTDGVRFGFDIIENENFRIVESIGDFIYSILIKCDEMPIDNSIYERWEYHKLNEVDGVSYESIEQICFENGKRINIRDVQGWDKIVESTIIPNVDKLLIGRFTCPKLNRDDVNSTTGVPITYGADEAIIKAKESWRRFNQEMEDKETMIFARGNVFKSETKTVRDSSGNLVTKEVNIIPKGKERIIKNMKSRSADDSMDIKEFSPDIRDASLDNAIERNFRMVEMLCGLSMGTLSKSTMTYTNTDEIKKSMQATYSFITAFRKILEMGMNDVLYSVDVICNLNKITPMGTWTANYDWSDSYVESMTERFNELIVSKGERAIDTAELRAWVMDEDVEIARQELAERQLIERV